MISRHRELRHDPHIIAAWLIASGWTFDENCPRFAWQDPEGWDTYSLRDAARAQAQLTASRKLRRRGWVVSSVGPGVASVGWARPPGGTAREITLVSAMRAEGLDGIYVPSGAPRNDCYTEPPMKLAT